jgi:hypothetical protein
MRGLAGDCRRARLPRAEYPFGAESRVRGQRSGRPWCPARATFARSDYSRTAVVMLKLTARFIAACIAERSAPLLRWKKLASWLFRHTFPYMCALRACRRRCIGAFKLTRSMRPHGVPVQQPPRLPNAPAFGVPVRHPPCLRAAFAGPLVGAQLGQPRRNRAAGALQGQGEWQVQHGRTRAARSLSDQAMPSRGPLPASHCTCNGGRPANKAMEGATRRLGGIEAASCTNEHRE